ncbi:D-hexose-6-phosphate mutarotase [Simiduia curdlanivorans]|uniref:Putative glucose-6-phosphate 1-epimerase n=1 Tax=Simiduia curdlanivorans TaxID=1492769 RepID=A0ABV8V7N8_9GAMM|nr:D-hexose-6-phosphate mutarotase [Simiduia curdlanivorans]MDN3639759.1 D-hexose-6-phosphate mutarotase [Simiduia curdlanivorans]
MQLPKGVNRGTSTYGLEYLDIEHPKARARIFLQGAQVTEFQATNQPPLLWLSPEEDFRPAKAIRGGVPICWPWFGAHAANAAAPAHGFARTSLWHLEGVISRDEGVTLTLSLPVAARPDWPHSAQLTLTVSISDHLGLALTTHNLGDTDLVLSQALHSYFDVQDITQVQITGLRGCRYDDQLLGEAGRGLLCAEGPLNVAGEVDRIVYPRQPIGVTTPTYDLALTTQGSASAVIWNPWLDKSARLSHFPADGYKSMLCVETANCGADARVIGAGASHSLAVEYRQLSTGKN